MKSLNLILINRKEGDSPAPPDFDGLVLSGEAWEKLIWFRDRKPVEVCCMGESHERDPLYIEKLHFIKQESTSCSVEFDNDAQQDYAIDMGKKGLSPDNFMRVWIHTHPSESASPSSTDWDTFEEAFAPMNWSVMSILGKSNELSCVFRVGDAMMNLPTAILDNDQVQWVEEYEQSIHPPNKKKHTRGTYTGAPGGTPFSTRKSGRWWSLRKSPLWKGQAKGRPSK